MNPNGWRPPESLYPFQSQWLELDRGVRLHYLDEGPEEAPIVLMLHGNPTWSFYYRNLIIRLRDRYRCIVPDHVGCGLSDKPDDDRYSYRLTCRIDDIERLMARVSPSAPVSLVVHDWGGLIGFGWAARHLERIHRCIILNTAAFRSPKGSRLPFGLWLAGRTRLGALLVRGANAFAGAAARLAFKQPVSQEIRQAYTAPYDNWRNRIATLRFVQDIPLREGDPGYNVLIETEQQLPCFADKPCLLAWGMRDFVFDAAFLRRWLEFLPDAEVHTYPDCGHYVLEDAGQSLIKTIEEFIQRDEPERPID